MSVKQRILVFALCVGLVPRLSAAQKIEDYLANMSQARQPYATLSGHSCRNLQIDISGPWGNSAIPESVDKASGKVNWLVLEYNLHRLYLNLSELDDDKVNSFSAFSLKRIKESPSHRPVTPDTSFVGITTSGLNEKITVRIVDLRLIHSSEKKLMTGEEMGETLQEQKSALLQFEDQEHAETFSRAIRKAVILCKSE